MALKTNIKRLICCLDVFENELYVVGYLQYVPSNIFFFFNLNYRIIFAYHFFSLYNYIKIRSKLETLLPPNDFRVENLSHELHRL